MSGAVRGFGQLDNLLIPGRIACQCLGARHKVITNCLTCGRIVCEQEGAGPCYFCGEIVGASRLSGDDTKIFRDQQRVTSIRDVLGGRAAAEAQRDRLLEYDRTSAARTQILDDQADYFPVGSVWLTEDEREKLSQRQDKQWLARHAPRSERASKVAFDFAGRVIDIPTGFEASAASEIDASAGPPGIAAGSASVANPLAFDDDEDMAKRGMTSAPVYVAKGVQSDAKAPSVLPDDPLKPHRLQDAALQEMSDRGVCLSVQQPWASLITCGAKRFEGRSWSTSHRGRLWISSSKKSPTKEDLEQSERLYRNYVSSGKSAIFPESYPTGVVVGCVNLVDCLPQFSYRELYPEGECDDPYVWIFEDPMRLSINFPAVGEGTQKQMYVLAKHIVRAAGLHLSQPGLKKI